MDIIILGVAGYLLVTKVWNPTRAKQTGLQAEMTAAWSGICAQIRARQTAGARLLEMAKAVAPQDPFTQSFAEPLAAQTNMLDDVQLAASREAPFTGLLESARGLEMQFPVLAADARWTAARQAADQANKKLDILRNQYNGAVLAYNKLFETFPANIVCAVCKLTPAPLFEAVTPLTEEDMTGEGPVK